MPNRSRDWLLQAERDLEQARESRGAGRLEWACFAARQGAEKAVKALHLSAGQEGGGCRNSSACTPSCCGWATSDLTLALTIEEND